MDTLLLSNHQSMIDGFVIGYCWYPKSWLKPSLLPWNPAAAENFYSNPFLAWLSDSILPKIGQTIYICYGRPVPLGDLYDLPAGREAADRIIGRVFEKIRRQQAVLERYRRRRARRLEHRLLGKLYRP